MDKLGQLFNVDAEFWQGISQKLDLSLAEQSDTSAMGGEFIRLKYKNWLITVDTYTVPVETMAVYYTRIRIPFLNTSNVRFALYEKTIFSQVAEVFGAQDIKVDDKAFDDAYMIKGNDEKRVQELLLDKRLHEMISAFPDMHLEVKDNEGYLGRKFPVDVDELCYHAEGIVDDPKKMQGLIELLETILERLCNLHLASRDDPHFEV